MVFGWNSSGRKVFFASIILIELSTITASFTGTILQRHGQITIIYEIRPDVVAHLQDFVYALDVEELSAIPNGARVGFDPGPAIGVPFPFNRFVTIMEWWVDSARI